ncbi:hypothetical protein L873DRAFT_1677843, partial [Choiromyces venosus 120613-1]
INQLALVQVLDRVSSRRFLDTSGYIQVCKQYRGQDMWVVIVGVMIRQVHLVPIGES